MADLEERAPVREINILDLPSEVIEYILQCKILDVRDICKVSETCSTLNFVCQSNEVWKKKLHRRWPKLIQRYRRSVSHNWSQEYKKCHVIGQKVRQMVSDLSPKYYKCEEISRNCFDHFVMMMDDDNAGETVLNELMDIIHHVDKNSNLTQKYYAAKAVRHLQHHHLKRLWKTHLEMPTESQVLETGAILVSQWCQPTENVIDNDIRDSLDKMEADVIAKCPQEIDSRFHNGKPPSSWSPQQERIILEALNDTLYKQYELKGNASEYYDEKNSFIDKVLLRRKGIPITLSIVYHAVARRLGVLCQLINFPTHLLMKWREHPLASPHQQFTYIDAFHDGKFLSQDDLPETFSIPAEMLKSTQVFTAIPPIEVYRRMCRNLISIGRQQGTLGDNLLCLRNALELALLLSPGDVEMRLLHIRVNLHLNVDLEEVKESLQMVSDLDQHQMSLVNYLMANVESQIEEYQNNLDKKIIPKLRNESKNKKVSFSVGLVMKHKRYHYMCVIYGWDGSCKATTEWIEQMGVNQLPKKQYQPFYNVLVEDGSNRYAAQENLLFPDEDANCVITHPEVGKFFKSFNGRYYMPNTEKLTEYPDDLELTQSLLNSQSDNA